MNSMAKKRREGEANSPRGQRPPGASRIGPSWAEFVRLAHQAVVAFAGTDMINRAEPRACGYSREPIGLDSEPDPKGTQARRQTRPETATEGRRVTRLGLQPYWGKPAVRDETRGWGNRQHDLMAICHDARKSRNMGSHWSKPGAPPPYSTGAFRPSDLCPSVFICGCIQFLRLGEFEGAAAVEELEEVAFMGLVPCDLHRGDGAEV